MKEVVYYKSEVTGKVCKSTTELTRHLDNELCNTIDSFRFELSKAKPTDVPDLLGEHRASIERYYKLLDEYLECKG